MRGERESRPIVALCQSLGLLVAAVLPLDAAAISAPVEARNQSYSISESAHEIVDPWPRQALGDDETFLRLLAAVLRADELTEEEKVDAFFLMFQKIGWAFTGTFTVPPGYTYAQMCSGQHLTLLRYQAALQALSYDGSGLMEIARTSCRENVVRCSHALLLAGLVDRDALRAGMKPLLQPEFFEKAEVPPILVYYLTGAAVLAREPEMITTVYDNLWPEAGEENRETVLCAVAVYDTDPAKSVLLDVVTNLDEVPAEQDQVVDALFALLRKRLPDELFDRVLTETRQSTTVHRAALDRLSANTEPAPQQPDLAGRTFTKVWDEFAFAMYDDGLTTIYGDKFNDFRPR